MRKKVPRSSHDLLGLHALAFPISLPEWCCRRFCMCASPPKQDPMARAQTRGLIGRPFFWLSSVTTGICKEEREGLRTNPTSLTCCFTWQTSARPRDPCKIWTNLVRRTIVKWKPISFPRPWYVWSAPQIGTADQTRKVSQHWLQRLLSRCVLRDCSTHVHKDFLVPVQPQFPASLILPPLGASEERPWHTLAPPSLQGGGKMSWETVLHNAHIFWR